MSGRFLVVLIAAATGGFKLLVSHFGIFSGSFWAGKKVALYDVAIWSGASAAASVWITYSIMQRRIIRVEQEAAELSHLDPATGLLNLRALNEQLPHEIEQTRQTKEPLTMIIFDIDGFKEVNTLIGHDRANLILKGVASLLSPRSPDQAFRYPENFESLSERRIFRYGGDEFIILAFNTTIGGGTDPGTGKKVYDGTTMAVRLQENVWNRNFPELANKSRQRRGIKKLTVSAGIADTIPSLDPDDTAQQLTRRAEAGLIEAKRLNTENPQRNDDFRGTTVPWTAELDQRLNATHPSAGMN
jgi:diguanylate cyclase (GGDEF)-like protein